MRPEELQQWKDKLFQEREEISATLEQQIPLQRGVFAAVSGPNLETAAEYRFLRLIGSDVVGMSLIPETIVARHSSMRVLALTVVTDECFPDRLEPASQSDHGGNGGARPQPHDKPVDLLFHQQLATVHLGLPSRQVLAHDGPQVVNVVQKDLLDITRRRLDITW